jgi:endonuclease YncB( thermonuclease family)
MGNKHTNSHSNGFAPTSRATTSTLRQKSEEKDDIVIITHDSLDSLSTRFRQLSLGSYGTPFFSLEGFRDYAKIVKVYDGDTVWAVIVYNGELTKFRCRLARCDAPEMRPPKGAKNRDRIIQRAKASRDFLQSLLPENGIVFMEVVGFEKWGRLLVELRHRPEDREAFSDILIQNGYAKSYDGGKKEEEFD